MLGKQGTTGRGEGGAMAAEGLTEGASLVGTVRASGRNKKTIIIMHLT